MSTFYGYAERQAEDSVDWSVIGKEITTMLQDESNRREKLKSDIDNASRKYGETLANAPTGQHKGASDGVLEFASNAQQARLIQDRLLKSGQLKVKDYLKQRQNITDGTKGLFAAAKEFQAMYQTKVDRMSGDESQLLEMYLFELTEGFGNWNTAGAYINPTTYEVSMGKKHRVRGKDGSYVYEMGERPDEYFTINELRNFSAMQLDRYDTRGALDKAAKSLGERNMTITYRDGKGSRTVSVSDISGQVFEKLKKQGLLTDEQISLVNKYDEYQEAIVNEMTANPYNALSILTDYVGTASNGKDFKFVWTEDEAKGNPEAILLEKDPQSGRPKVKLSPDQEDYIAENINNGIDQRLKQTVTDTYKPDPKEKPYRRAPTTDEINKTNAGKHIKDYSVWIKPLLTGNPQQIQDALNKITNKNQEIEEAKIIDNGSGGAALVYKMRDTGITKTIVNDIGKISAEEFVESVIFNDYGGLIDDDFNTMYKDIIKATDIGGITPVKYTAMDEFKAGKLVSTPSSYAYVDDMTFGKDKGKPQRQVDIYKDNLADMSDKYDSSAMTTIITNSYQQAPDGKRLEQNPLNPDNFTITPLPYETVGNYYSDSYYFDGYSDAGGFVISSPFGPDLLIPVGEAYNENIPALMDYLKQTVLDGGKYNFTDVASKFNYGNYVIEFLNAYAGGAAGGETKNPGRGEGKKVKNKSGGTSR